MTPQEQALMAQLAQGNQPQQPQQLPAEAQMPMTDEQMQLAQLMQMGQLEQDPMADPMAMQQASFKKAYKGSDEDFKSYGFRKLLKESHDKQKKLKLTDWKHEPSLNDLKHDFIHAQSSQSAYMNKLAAWQKLYDAPKWGDKNHQGSRINPKLVRKQGEWNAPALSEPFLSTSNLFDVKPLTFEDVDRAKQNALILNRQFNTQLKKVSLVDGIIRQLVKNGSCVLRMGWEYKEETVNERVPIFKYNPVPQEELEAFDQEFNQIQDLYENKPSQYEILPEEVKAGFEMTRQKNQALMAMPSGFTHQKRQRVTVNRPTAQLCNIKNIYVDPTCRGNLDDAQFIIHAYESSLSELKKQGIYENLGYLQEHQESGSHTMDKPDDTGFRFQDVARRKLTVHEYWGYWDTDGTGQTKPIVAAWVGDVLIRMEENPFPKGKLPFVIFNFIPEEDSVFGIPNAELLGDNQEILGAVTRGMIDLLGKSANSQTGFSKNFLDQANKLKFSMGQNYEYNHGFDPRVHVYTHSYPEIPNSAMAMVQMMNNEAESLSGVKAFSGTGISSANLGEVAVGIRGVLDAVSKREMSILRRISEGFVAMGRFIMAMNAEFLSEKEVVRITNEEFVAIRRDDLAGEYDLSLTISTAEGDESKAQQLAFMMQTIGNSMGMGLTQLIMSEIATLRKMPHLAKAIEEYHDEPDPMMQQMQELELQKLQAEIELMKSEAQENMAKAQVHGAKVGVEEARAESLQGDADNKVLDFMERNTGARYEHELNKQALINDGQNQREYIRGQHQLDKQAQGHDQHILDQLAQAQIAQDYPDPSQAGQVPNLANQTNNAPNQIIPDPAISSPGVV